MRDLERPSRKAQPGLCGTGGLGFRGVAAPLREVDHENRDVGGRDAGDPAGLADGPRPHAVELLPGLEAELGHGREIDVRRDQQGVGRLQALDRLGLALEVPRVAALDEQVLAVLGA